MSPVLVIITIVAAVVLFIVFLPKLRSRNKNKKNTTGRTFSSTSSIPKERAGLTAYLKRNYPRIEQAKKMTLNSEQFSQETATWLEQLGWQVSKVGLLTKDITVKEKFAAIFVVNHIFHKYESKQAEAMKNFLQKTIILYHEHEVGHRIVRGRGRSEMLEIYCGVFTTHLPEHVVERGKIVTEQEILTATRRTKKK